MLRPHGGPQNHLLRNATIIFMFRMYLNRFLYPFELIVFGVTLRFWQLRSNATGKSSHLSIYPYVWTPWGSPKEFVTECHHNRSIPYVPGNVLVGIRTKGFWCNTLNFGSCSRTQQEIFPVLRTSVCSDPMWVLKTICYGMPP